MSEKGDIYLNYVLSYSRSNSNGKEVISRDAKRPRASRTRAEECIKNLSRRDSENDDDDIGNHEDADFHASSEDESAYSEDDNSRSLQIVY